MSNNDSSSSGFDLSRLRLKRTPQQPQAVPIVAPASKPTASQQQPFLQDVARKHVLPLLQKRISISELQQQPRAAIARKVEHIFTEWLAATGQDITPDEQHNNTAYLLDALFESAPSAPAPQPVQPPIQAPIQPIVVRPSPPVQPFSLPEQQPLLYGGAPGSKTKTSDIVLQSKSKIQPVLLNRIDAVAAASLPRDDLQRQIDFVISDILLEQRIQLNIQEKRELVILLLDDMLGLGPLEPLLADEAITDIMVNGPNRTYIERGGKMQLTDVRFRDNQHLLNIATRIVSAVGRRIDESQPLMDARLPDGSRVNIIIPPLALDGPSLSIRKFSNKGITLPMMVQQGNVSAEMATVLQIAARCRLNIIISGGTGSGKTTLLNAMSQMIDPTERVVTVEDSAELRLQQPHVVRLETRAANLEGEGEINIRDLVKNALRMRPDRIIVGECRGSEIIDMLQAMNTGHDGSMSTIHANNPRTALTRMENMLNMAGFSMPEKVTRSMISSAVNLIVQIQRMRDGIRRISHIMEVVGMEETTIVCQDLFWYEFKEETSDGRLLGQFVSSGLRPHFTKRAEYYGLSRPLIEAMG